MRKYEPNFFVTADTAIFRRDGNQLSVLLVKRRKESNAFPDHWALPGGFVKPTETFQAGGLRELQEETGLVNNRDVHVWFLNMYDRVDRDPRGRIVSALHVGYQHYLHDEAHIDAAPVYTMPLGADDAQEAKFFDVLHLPENIAFDHEDMIRDALSEIEQ